jgi:hypothetical protein
MDDFIERLAAAATDLTDEQLGKVARTVDGTALAVEIAEIGQQLTPDSARVDDPEQRLAKIAP